MGLLLAAKALSVCLDFRDGFRANVCKYVIFMFLDILWLPMAYLMAMPLEASLQVAKDDTSDVDIALRLWCLAARPAERRRCLAAWRAWWRCRLAVATQPFRRHV